MTGKAKEVLYDSETVLRLVDSEMQELRVDLAPAGEVATPSPVLPPPQRAGEQEAKVSPNRVPPSDVSDV